MNVLLLWHMHQPYYVDPTARVARMPWVRLHAVKGYLDMIDLLASAPEVKVNFNFTPVLVRQIEEFVSGEVTDLWETWSRKDAAGLDEDEKLRLLENFFKINWDNLIHPFPRYAELLRKRGLQWDNESLRVAAEAYTTADYRDLQTWYNLAWCGFSAERRYPVLAELKKQGRDFTEAQKRRVLDIHKEILGLLLPLYRKAAEEGRIELTTTPYFHPILPLVCDTNFARRAMPHAELPPRFAAAEDAAAQLRLAQELHARTFGRPARGLWPSEGSVAPEMIPLLRQNGIDYFCTDEGILFRSLENDPHWRGRKVDHLELFQGWRATHDGASVNALFRERPLSDFIGFNASKGTPAASADYLLHHLDHLANVCPEPRQAVLLALDGENAWEAFPDGGKNFLTLFYQGLARNPKLCTRRLGDYFDELPPTAEVSRLHTGSWIRSDFDIWIGDAEENKAWDWLGRTRHFLLQEAASGRHGEKKIAAAWWEIYAAEGSDWFWWYGPDFTTDCDFLFDDLFRTHLKNVYVLLGFEPPAYLDDPICLSASAIAHHPPRMAIRPAVSGKLASFFDWTGAGSLDLERQQTAMFQSDRIGRRLLYGFDEERFYLRLDLSAKPQEIELRFLQPSDLRATLLPAGGGWRAEVEESRDHVTFTPVPVPVEAAWEEFLVLAIPRRALGWTAGGTVAFNVRLSQGGIEQERYPERGSIEFSAPADDFAASQWFV